MTRFVPLLCATSVLTVLVASCHAKDSGGADGAASASAAAASGSGAGDIVIPSASAADDEVRPVYPVDDSPPNPLAQRFCTALHETQPTRRAECCKSGHGILLTRECVRNLSAALRFNAVTLGEADVDRCIEALGQAYAGCEWVGPFPPPPPEACTAVVKGKLTAGAVCRSTLECAEPLRCHGVGPTTLGRCGPPYDAGGSCGGTVDALAAYTAADARMSVLHPECKGYCARRACADVPPDGSPCKLSTQCGPQRGCIAGKCTSTPPGKLGEACVGGLCESDLRCEANKCVGRKKAGEACAQDFECEGGCLKTGAAKTGTCGMKCDFLANGPQLAAPSSATSR